MTGKLHFLIIPSRTGRRREFSLSRNFIACMIMLCLLLAGTGIWGALKYNENNQLKENYQFLEVEKNKYEAVARKLQAIEKDEDSVRQLLGLQSEGDSGGQTLTAEKK